MFEMLPHVDPERLWLLVGVHLWQSTLVLVPIFLLDRMLVRAPARFLHALWWAALLKLFLPLPLFGRATRAAAALLFSGSGAFSEAAGTMTSALAGIVHPLVFVIQVRGGSSRLPLGAYGVLSLLWLGGVVWLLLRWTRSGARLRRMGRTSPVREESPEGRRLFSALQNAGIPADRVRIVREGVIPVVVGIFRPRILVPERLLERLDPEHLKAVLLHEDAHRRRMDPVLGLVQRAAILVFFYYPVLYPVLRRLRATTELVCDERVLACGVSRTTYRGALARTLSLGLEPAPTAESACVRSSSLLRQRFRRLTASWRCGSMWLHRLVLATGCAIVILGSFAPMTPAPSAPDTETAVETSVDPRLWEELGRLERSETVLSLDLYEGKLDEVLRLIAAEAGFDVEIEGLVSSQPVTLRLKGKTVRQALVEIWQAGALIYEVPREDVLTVLVPEIPGVGGVTNPRRIPEAYVAPVYPEQARKDEIQGRVLLQLVIGTDGHVGDVEVLRDSTQNKELADNAVKAVKQWRYDPATLDGKPVPVYVTVIIEYSLE